LSSREQFWHREVFRRLDRGIQEHRSAQIGNPAILRIGIADRKLELIGNLQNLPTTGNLGPWIGLAQDDSPLLLKDTGTRDIDALDWEEP
jgi:hypothetical protein